MLTLVVGEIVLTAGVYRAMAERSFSVDEITLCLNRHASCDFGDLDAHDRAMNARAFRTMGRIHSAYHLPGGTLWIITEADRTVTTVLLPREY